MRVGSNCDTTAQQRAQKSLSKVASPAQREGATVETTYMLALRNEGPPPDAKRAQAALKYMPPDGPKATVKWPSRKGNEVEGCLASSSVRRVARSHGVGGHEAHPAHKQRRGGLRDDGRVWCGGRRFEAVGAFFHRTAEGTETCEETEALADVLQDGQRPGPRRRHR